MWSACQNMPSCGFSSMAFLSLKPARRSSWWRSGGVIAFTRSNSACASRPQIWQMPCSTAKICVRAAAMLDLTLAFSSQAGEQNAFPASGVHGLLHQAHAAVDPSAVATGRCRKRFVLGAVSALRCRSVRQSGSRRVWSISWRCSVTFSDVHSRRKALVLRTAPAWLRRCSGKGGSASGRASQSESLKFQTKGLPAASSR
mmetsp:Transcript_91446/g.258960  ORF Transcript_91446/g.258960 Transcript_91446/m.258960 type:complete len:200 (-) Transcript_91446:125-724(-)